MELETPCEVKPKHCIGSWEKEISRMADRENWTHREISSNPSILLQSILFSNNWVQRQSKSPLTAHPRFVCFFFSFSLSWTTFYWISYEYSHASKHMKCLQNSCMPEEQTNTKSLSHKGADSCFQKQDINPAHCDVSGLTESTSLHSGSCVSCSWHALFVFPTFILKTDQICRTHWQQLLTRNHKRLVIVSFWCRCW